MILHHELDASWLTGYHKAAEHLALHPDLAVLADDDALRLNSAEIVEPLYDVHRLLIRDELLLPFPCDTDARADFIPDAGET